MHRSANQKEVSDLLYPAIRPFDMRMLKVPGGHRIHVEQCGNPDGAPVIVLHGGPGGGCTPGMRRFFDPDHYRIILFDQRGCGRSTPHASVENNTTWDLVADIERIRDQLGVERWAVFGGSWGATLALVYAQKHPDRVRALILRGVFLGTQGELDWFYGGGASAFWPERWQDFIAPIPEEERNDLITAYHRRLFSGSKEQQLTYARAWSAWESGLAVLEPGSGGGHGPSDYLHAFARLENHYFKNAVFLRPDQAILNNLDRLKDIPGVIVQGRYDMICPPRQAHALASGWRAARLEMVPAAGHALSEPGITRALVAATDRMRNGAP